MSAEESKKMKPSRFVRTQINTDKINKNLCSSVVDAKRDGSKILFD